VVQKRTTIFVLTKRSDMKKSISFQAIETSGTRLLSTYYWNGHEFITACKVTFPEEVIMSQFEKAKAALTGFVALCPDKYNFGIK
jgi:hypothetical protein